MPFDKHEFTTFFERCSHYDSPYDYQVAVAEHLDSGRHVEVWAPTGAGKTLAVLAPFLWQYERGGRRRWDRLIYVLPLRSLVESIAVEAEKVVAKLGRADVSVKVQTGERPDERFFAEGTIIVTTYDQLLSGALEGPYGLPGVLHNINAAAVAGALVVFDEYHLMEPGRSFQTAVAHLALYRPLCQSVWMTATATSPLRDQLADALDVTQVAVSDDELARIPAVAEVERRLVVMDEPLSAAEVIRLHKGRSIALVNTVGRANLLYDQLRVLYTDPGTFEPRERVILLHGRFLPADRKRIEEEVRRIFGRGSDERCILVCTQVIEAGMNMSANMLHTEAAPMSALIQRAGRCARFPGEIGEVRVYPLPEAGGQPWLPYDHDDVADALMALRGLQPPSLDPTVMRALVEDAHGPADERRLRGGWFRRQTEILDRAHRTAVLRDPATVGDLIRNDDGQTIRVVVAREPSTLNPYAVEGFGLRRWSLAALFELPSRPVGWRWAPSEDLEWVPLASPSDLAQAFAVCLHPDVVDYSDTTGVRLGRAGQFESPPRERPQRHRVSKYRAESWPRHAREVGERAARLVEGAGSVLHAGLADERWQLTARLLVAAARATGVTHDVGKLQVGWQDWAARAQWSRDPSYIHTQPLAHTDLDRDNPADRERERAVDQGGRRPSHAAASAYYSGYAVVALLQDVSNEVSPPLFAACLAAVLGHHGGWLGGSSGDGGTLGIQPLVAEADAALAEATPERATPLRLAPPRSTRPARPVLESLLRSAIDDDRATWWPVVAYLTRVLRLVQRG